MARKPADQSVNRQEILVAAADILQRNGYEATTMKDIAAEVNLTAASLYHHFENKDMLLLAVLEAGLDEIIRRMEPIAQSDKDCREKLRAMIAIHVTGQTDNTAVGAAMIFEIRSLLTATGKAQAGRFIRQRDYFEGLFRQVVQDGIEAGDFRPVDVPIFVKTMLGAHNWISVWYQPTGRLNGTEIAEQMAETFLRALILD
ncbi:MAG: TetR/AcrR family transcriptional regulator [Anaerolineae bacterium]|nr:TetR/AcrR family transcriptional regulator [Anaerolineae bacterium]